MRLLALSFPTTKELNEKGFALYADFRPDVAGWGQRAEVRCSSILEGRSAVAAQKMIEKPEERVGDQRLNDVVKFEDTAFGSGGDGAPPTKRAKDMSVEDYEATLDSLSEFEDFINSVDC